jgi:hypothetical protein
MPSSVRIPQGKKRYTFTLTETTMNRMHAIFGRNHAPKSVLSGMIDDFLLDTVKTIEELSVAQKRKGQEITLGDLFTVMGTIMTDKETEQRKLL